MTKIRTESGTVYDAKEGDVLFGGIEPKGDKFVPMFEIHRDCKGGEHRGCTIVERFTGPEVATFDEAADWVGRVQTDLMSQGLTDWKPVAGNAKA